MNEDIHREDEPFKKAYERMEENPSPEVWENINAQLNSKDAVYYRNRFVTWKRIACLLLLLLITTLLFQVFIPADQKSELASTQSGVASGSVPATTTGEQTTTNDAIHQRAETSVGPTDSSLIDKPGEMVTEKIHNNDSHPQSLSAQTIKEATNDLYLVQPKSTIDKSDIKQLSVRSTNPLFHLQEQTRIVFDSFSNPKQQSAKFVISNSIKSKSILSELNKDNSNSQLMLQKNSSFKTTFSPDSSGNKTTVVASNKATIKVHKRSVNSWTITPFVSADFTGYALDDDTHERGNGSQPEHHKQEIEGRETHQFSFSAGAFARWHFSPKISLQTGLVYSNISIGIQPQTLYASRDNNQNISYKFITSSGYAYVNPVFGSTPATGDSITANISHHHLQFLMIPVTFGYRFPVNKRLSVTPGVGLSANILLSTRVRTEINEDTDKEVVVINKLQGIRKTYVSFMADADVNYSINRRFSLSLLPMFKYAINPITNENVVKTFPYSFSIGAGITYSF